MIVLVVNEKVFTMHMCVSVCVCFQYLRKCLLVVIRCKHNRIYAEIDKNRDKIKEKLFHIKQMKSFDGK